MIHNFQIAIKRALEEVRSEGWLEEWLEAKKEGETELLNLMLNRGVSVAKIAEIIKLPIEEIKKASDFQISHE